MRGYIGGRGGVHPSSHRFTDGPTNNQSKKSIFHTAYTLHTCIENCQKETKGVYTYCTGSPVRSRDRNGEEDDTVMRTGATRA